MPRIAPDAVTRLTFGADLAWDVAVIPYLTIVALFYVASGVIGLAPLPGVNRARFWLLLACGVLIFPTILVIAAVGQSTNATSMLASSLRLATPIIIGAMAGIWCERSGVVNIAIEGMMLTGACFGFLAFSIITSGGVDSQSALVMGVVVAVLAGGAMALLHGWLSITFKTDQIV
ncbi:MAG: ABC transporter permease, partial [Anaerolineae bacterium]|nr:ABC transporter permease [Anaerolineae bacterium]